MRHMIRKQVIDWQSAAGNDTFQYHQRIQHYYYNKLVPVLQKVFDELTVDDELIQLDRVEIDLGLLSWNEWKPELNQDELYQKVRSQILQCLGEQPDISGQQPIAKGDFFSMKKTDRRAEQWMYYLQHGYMPWSVSETDLTNAWYDQVLEAFATNYRLIDQFKNVIRINENVRTRIVKEQSETFLVKLLEVITASSQSALPTLIETLLDRVKNNSLLAGVEMTADKQIWIKRRVWQELIERSPEVRELPWLVERWTKEWEHFVSGKLYRNSSLGMEKVLESFFEEGKQTESVVVTETKETISATREMKTDAGGIFVRNAGLILAHPFLKSLFERLAITRQHQFINEEEQARAVLLLGYIAEGLEMVEEYKLVVPKILCGWIVEQGLPGSLELPDQYKQEAEEMLAALIAQWPILKNTSVDGLREGFLQRTGKVVVSKEQIDFSVEAHAIDVLIDHMPWNLSIVKLPWLDTLIKVEWR